MVLLYMWGRTRKGKKLDRGEFASACLQQVALIEYWKRRQQEDLISGEFVSACRYYDGILQLVLTRKIRKDGRDLISGEFASAYR